MKILVLGGIAESKELTLALLSHGHDVIYSIAGLVRTPDLPCEVHSGGFSNENMDGKTGLANFCIEKQIDLLVDATHPYATEISENAASTIQAIKIPCWRFNRPGWNAKKYPNWHDYSEFTDLLPQIAHFSRPFLSIGISALKYTKYRPTHQQWVVRSARPFDDQAGIIQINAIGPFDLNDEIKLMKNHSIDALISKNSGCNRVSAKMDAAAQLGIPVFVQRRPELALVDQSFGEITSLVDAIA
jgi:precorrin-6A/cobalt-precorrin-6A reductase